MHKKKTIPDVLLFAKKKKIIPISFSSLNKVSNMFQ